MILKCPNCDAALEYDAASNHMYCPYCASYFDVSELDTGSAAQSEPSVSDGPSFDPDSQYEETMESNIYTCTSCGAEVMINGVESATFCIYCGQPTIVFNRVSKMRKPKYIIPFSVTKEQAHDIIRTKLCSGKYVPNSVKNFKLEMIRGIYVPFMLYDIDYYARQLIKSVHKRGKSSVTYYHYREARNQFIHITVDSSVSFNDESSQRLEPYNFNTLQPFQVGFLSGYYADCMDESTGKMEVTAINRCKQLFDRQIMSSINGSREIVEDNHSATITASHYVMLPVWFVIFREQNRHYTIMVNGQTGKMIGAVPCEKKKVALNLGIFCTLFSVISAPILSILFAGISGSSEDFGKLAVLVVFAIACLFGGGFHAWTSYQKSHDLTTANQIKHLVADRQGSNGI